MDKLEREALKFVLRDFKGEIYLFGSRLDDDKKGGDIDILLIPRNKANTFKLSLKVEARFFSICEEKIDVLVYDKNNLFFKEILKNAKRIDIKRI